MGSLKKDLALLKCKFTGAPLPIKAWESNNQGDIMSRSPKESPPVEKKRLKRLSTDWMMARQSSLNSSFSDENIDSERPRSILKRAKSGGSGRRVQFNRNTFWQQISEDGEKSTGTETLCMVEKDRKAFMNRNLNRISSQFQTDRCSMPSYGTNQNGLVFSYEDKNSHLSPEVHISFSTNNSQQGTATKLKMLVNVGAQFNPDEICVKANMSGSKIRVMATKIIETENGAIEKEPFNERFLLPMEVDPYGVEARLDNKGNLTIEAPLMTHTRRSDIAKEQTETATKSL